MAFNALLSLSDLTHKLGLHAHTIRRWVAAGNFPEPLRYRGMKRWRADEIEDWINAIDARSPPKPAADTPAAPEQCDFGASESDSVILGRQNPTV